MFEQRPASLRTVVNSVKWEMGMLMFVLFYFVVVFVTFALDDQKVRCPQGFPTDREPAAAPPSSLGFSSSTVPCAAPPAPCHARTDRTPHL